MIPPDPITGRLMPGERIVWQGQPKQGFLLTQRDLLLIPSSLAFCAFSIFLENPSATPNVNLPST